MSRRRGCMLALALVLAAGPLWAVEAPVRGMKIVAAADAPEPIRAAARAVLAAVKTQPTLAVLLSSTPPALPGEAGGPTELTDSAALLADRPPARAYSHLVLIGLPSDPMIRAAWQREARLLDDGSIYIYGFGHLAGDIGYIESDRNPFLHSQQIAKAPFETEVVTLTGNTPAGVKLAVDAFLKHALIGGVVAAPGWRRAGPSLLQRDPLPPDFAPPDWLPREAGPWRLAGVIQASEDEYRGVLADTGAEPSVIWRAKYYRPGVWDAIDGATGQKVAPLHYHAGLHRRSYGNTLWAAEFGADDTAVKALPQIGGRAGLSARSDGVWSGAQPPLGYGESTGDMRLWRRGAWLVMSTLPAGDTPALK